jgi:hypothetical protein
MRYCETGFICFWVGIFLEIMERTKLNKVLFNPAEFYPKRSIYYLDPNLWPKMERNVGIMIGDGLVFHGFRQV